MLQHLSLTPMKAKRVQSLNMYVAIALYLARMKCTDRVQEVRRRVMQKLEKYHKLVLAEKMLNALLLSQQDTSD